MDILNVLSQDKTRYFFSISEDDDAKIKRLVCGGLMYGQIEIEITDDHVTVSMTNSDAAGSAMTISREQYPNLTKMYKVLVQFISDIEIYLSLPQTEIYQEQNRQVLMRNMIELLPKHSNDTR